ncbi:FG-GAP repeat domain-containing protein [Snuella sedimenti]|uniref:VCBS repeat-containing protein n=1 Tax=Snuella sedimenti TaxID=2798802 RepID=A0A8J7LQ15_9FLAO|nr:VCBS repeat-containing protein [Snuella sedimenti]MBJ6369594.1 VCBS repeat-containing protein [Snuella sedimenti]
MNGKYDVFLAKYNKDKQVSVRGLECSSEQMPGIRKKFKTYAEFANADINEILGEGINYGLHLKAETFSSIMVINHNGTFEKKTLPIHAQFSTIQGVVTGDFTNDGVLDILIAGNQFDNEIETSRADASCGLVLEGKQDGTFKAISPQVSGFFVPYNVKDCKPIKLGKENSKLGILVATNNDTLRIYTNNR